MTERKRFKQHVRARMEKTGERYTAARRHVVKDAEAPVPAPDAPEVSSEAVARATGRGWDEWFAVLDEWGASGRPHREIARHLVAEHGLSGWWSQSVTVGYERARGLRDKHQRPDGFAVGATRTVALSPTDATAAFLDEARRMAWCPDAPLRLRTARPERSVRFDWGDGQTRVNVAFQPKGDGRTTISVDHERLPDAAEAARMKAFWRERLRTLAEQTSA